MVSVGLNNKNILNIFYTINCMYAIYNILGINNGMKGMNNYSYA